MRVVHASCYIDPLGREPEALLAAWPSLGLVAAAVARAGAAVTVVQAAGTDHDTERGGVRFAFVAEPAPTRLRRRLGPGAWRLPHRMAARIEALQPDVLHVHGLGFARQAGWLAGRLPHARVLLQDHADGPATRWTRARQRQGLAGVHGVAFTAVEQARPFRAAGLLREGTPVFAVPESSSTFSPGDAADARAATGLHGDPCLLWLGRLDRNKDPLTVLDAVARVAELLPDTRLWCCYRSAPLLDAVRSRITANRTLRDRVQLLGERPHGQVELLLRAADFLVQGSHREAAGYAVIEAMACGTPPLVTDIPPFRALTGNGRFGRLAPPGDAAGMARAWLPAVRTDRGRLRTAVRAHFERELSPEAVGIRLLSVYGALRP